MASVRDRAGHEVDGGQRENGGGAAAGQKNAILLQETDGVPGADGLTNFVARSLFTGRVRCLLAL